MSCTVDANVLVYASDAESPFHERARQTLEALAAGPEMLYLFWPTTLAYLRIATHPAVFRRPLALAQAMANVHALLALPHVQAPGEQPRFWHRFADVARDAAPTGRLVPDAHLVALMQENGVRAIWTHDRDFRRFRGIEIRDPFDAGPPV